MYGLELFYTELKVTQVLVLLTYAILVNFASEKFYYITFLVCLS
jgi:hypothetical protein